MKRRQLLEILAKTGAGSALLTSCSLSKNNRSTSGDEGNKGLSLNGDGGDKRFLIVLTASGGASIIDAAMAMSRAEVEAAGGNADTMNCFGDAQLTSIAGSPFKAVKVDHTIGALGGYGVQTDQAPFMQKYKDDMLVATIEGTSVNHGVAQRRSITGNDAWQGRTLQEAVASEYGKDLPLANLNLGAGGFAIPGIDASLPDYARQVSVTNSAYWPLGLHGYLGLDSQLSGDALAKARELRSNNIEANSNFFKTFKDNKLLKQWRDNQRYGQDVLEDKKLAEKLYWYPKTSGDLKPNSESSKLTQLFPNYERDSFDAQAILAYLAITEGASCAVTLGPDSAAATSEQGLAEFYNPPIAYDFSHTDHRGTQAMMWARMMRVADKLAELLKQKEFGNGQSYWDRTMIYFATDFGRSRERAAGSESFSSGHDLNNGIMLMSPLANGGQVLGGVNPATGMTYGFDPLSGAAEAGRTMSEKEIYAGLLQIMGINPSGLPDMRAMKKS
jgi:hypothetical protein